MAANILESIYARAIQPPERAVTIAFILLLTVLFTVFWKNLDSNEPPVVKPRIPIIGHFLGIILNGVPYYAMASGSNPPPIFTLDLFFVKMYVINSAKLVSAVQKNHRIISFDPFLTAAANRMAGINGDGLELLREPKNGGSGVNNKVLHSMHPALLGPGLDKMNKGMITNLKKSIDTVTEEKDGFDLHLWCRHAISLASTDAVYGPKSPYKDRIVEDSLWTFESNLSYLLLNWHPRFTARKAYLARERLVAALVKYYEAGGHETSSELTYGRWKTQHDAGASTENTARLEAAAGIGIMSNTVPSTFWSLFEVYSRPELLAECRKEVEEHALFVEGEGDNKVHCVDLAEIRDRCHRLVSAFQETLRLRSNGAPTRVVYDDIMLDDKYLLKAGSVVQMPAPSVNREAGVWGGNSKEYDADRFRPRENGAKQGKATGYMSFGASPNICPGRHFAVGKIMALVAMMILRYDITPTAGRGWKPPKLNVKALAASVTPPVEAFPVKATVRSEYAGTKWDFKVTEGKGKFNLVVG